MTQQENILGSMPMGRLVIHMSWPIMISMLMQAIYNLVDSLFVVRISDAAFLALSYAYPVQSLMVAFCVGTGVGFSALLAKRLGQGDQRQANSAVFHGLLLYLGCWILFLLFGLFACRAYMDFCTDTAQVAEMGVEYLRICCCFSFGMCAQFPLERILQSTGHPMGFMIIQGSGAVINLIFDPILIFGFDMGVAGAALATLIAQAVSAVLVIWALARSKDIFRMEVKRIRFHARPLRMILWIGLPAGLQSVLYSLSNIVIQTSLNAFGTDTMAAWSSLGKLDAFYWMVSSAFGIAITTFVGQCYGAGKYKRMRKSVRVCFGMAMVTAILISALLLLFGKYVFRVFTGDQEVIRIGVQMLNMMAPSYFIYVFIEIFSGALRGRGDVIIPMILTCGGVCGLRVLWIMLAVPVSPSIFTIILSYPITWVVTAILFIIYYWIKNREIAAMPDREETKNA